MKDESYLAAARKVASGTDDMSHELHKGVVEQFAIALDFRVNPGDIDLQDWSDALRQFWDLVPTALRVAIAATSSNVYPRLWALFPFVLPRTVRERVYDPAHQELLEDYFRAQALGPGKWARRWLTFAFTIRTVGLVGGSLWEAAGAKGRRAVVATLTFAAGASGYSALREWLAVLRGRLN